MEVSNIIVANTGRIHSSLFLSLVVPFICFTYNNNIVCVPSIGSRDEEFVQQNIFILLPPLSLSHPRFRLPSQYECPSCALSSCNGTTDGTHDERVPHRLLRSLFCRAPYDEAEHHQQHHLLENRTGRLVHRRCSRRWDACERTNPTIHEDDWLWRRYHISPFNF